MNTADVVLPNGSTYTFREAQLAISDSRRSLTARQQIAEDIRGRCPNCGSHGHYIRGCKNR